MNILILEDDENRNALFRKNLAPLSIEIRDDVKELKTLLLNKKWDVLFLDHDLGGEVFVDSNREDTGSEVARWLNENPERLPNMIFIHTMNPDGQINMKKLLPSAFVLPFAWTKVDTELLQDDNAINVFKEMAKGQSSRLEMYGKL
ncbi:unnamed protein product [marine sediment metagenome]|uniref:Cyclic-phosphate processing Receiver domain-containing protein n=1 Tax=marine sediment metagenome TaxID=412755 RepID=X1FE19_9ZZZZ